MPVTSTRRAFLRSGVLGMGALAGCLGGGSEGPRTVRMPGDFAFGPQTVTVGPETTVRWVNESEISHTVTAYEDGIPEGATYFASGGFDTERAARNDLKGGLIPIGEAYEHRFEVSGTYEYYCIPHEGSGMTGTVEVR